MLKYIILLFVILLIIEYYVFEYYQKKKNSLFDNEYEAKQLENNKKNIHALTDIFKHTIEQRVHALKNMDYTDWLLYNQKNSIITNNDIKYNIFIYEKSETDNTFIIRCSYPPNFINQNYLDELIHLKNESPILESFPPSSRLPEEMYNMSLSNDGFNNISFNWYNYFTKNPVLDESIFTKYNKNNFSGVIGISYTKEYLDIKYNNIFINYVHPYVLLFLHASILLISCSVFLMSHHPMFGFFESIVTLLISWFFLIYQLFLSTSITNIAIETQANNIIYENLLGVAYLITVPLSFIEYFKKTSEADKKIIFFMCISILFLLLSLVKLNTFKNLETIRIDRIQNQIFFNYGLLYIFLVFAIFILRFFFKKV